MLSNDAAYVTLREALLQRQEKYSDMDMKYSVLRLQLKAQRVQGCVGEPSVNGRRTRQAFEGVSSAPLPMKPERSAVSPLVWKMPSLRLRHEEVTTRLERQAAWRTPSREGPSLPPVAAKLLCRARQTGDNASSDTQVRSVGSNSGHHPFSDVRMLTASSHLSSSLSAPSYSDVSDGTNNAEVPVRESSPSVNGSASRVNQPSNKSTSHLTKGPSEFHCEEALSEWEAIDRGEVEPYPSYLFHPSVRTDITRDELRGPVEVPLRGHHPWSRSATAKGVCVQFSPSGEAFLVGFSDGVICYVPTDTLPHQHATRRGVSYLGNVELADNMNSWKLKKEFLYGHTDSILSIAFSDSGGEFATSSADRSLILWSTATRSKVRRITTASNHSVPEFVVFAPHNNNYCILNFRGNPNLEVFNTSTGLPVTSPASSRDAQPSLIAEHHAAGSITAMAVNASIGPFVFTGSSRGGVSLWTSFHCANGCAPAVPLLDAHPAKLPHRFINEIRFPQLRRVSTLYLPGTSRTENSTAVIRVEFSRLTLSQARLLSSLGGEPRPERNDAWFSALSTLWDSAVGKTVAASVGFSSAAPSLFQSLCALQLVVTDSRGSVHFLGVSFQPKYTRGHSSSSRNTLLIYSLVVLRSCPSPACNRYASSAWRGAALAQDDRLVTLAYASDQEIRVVSPSPVIAERATGTVGKEFQAERTPWITHSCIPFHFCTAGDSCTDVAWSPDSRFLVVSTASGAVKVWERLLLPHLAGNGEFGTSPTEGNAEFTTWSCDVRESWLRDFQNTKEAFQREHSSSDASGLAQGSKTATDSNSAFDAHRS